MPDSAYRVEWTRCEIKTRAKLGENLIARVEFRNVSDRVWPTTVRVGCSWTKADFRGRTPYPANRSMIERPVAPGQTVLLDRIEIIAPAVPGRYLLHFDLVNEFIAWFSDKGAPSLSIPVTVVR